MFKLLAERETLNGLSMLDPLTGYITAVACKIGWIRYRRRAAMNTTSCYWISSFQSVQRHYGHMIDVRR